MSSHSEEQRLMRQSCRAFVDDVVIPFVRHNWQREWNMVPQDRLPPEILEGADQIGIRTLGVPEEFGGLELDRKSEVRTFALISEEIARGDSGLADKLVQNWKVSVLLRRLAPRHLQEKWFKRLVDDPQFLLAHCLTEPRGASDRWLPYNVPEAAMQTRAVRKNGEWVINGRKQFISNGYDDATGSGARPARPRRARRRRRRARGRHAVQHGQGVRVRGGAQGGAARARAARRQRRDARFRRGEDLPRRCDLPAHGRYGGHLALQDREVDVPAHRRQVRRPGGVTLQQTPPSFRLILRAPKARLEGWAARPSPFWRAKRAGDARCARSSG